MDFTKIIFRGRRQADKKTWIFGDLEHNTTDMFINVTLATENMHKYPISLFSRCCVESQTVGVNFGHKDINDKLIFTGDIVKDADNYIYKVMADEYLFLEDISNKHAPIMLNNFSAVILQLQVIGNIFDNNELLNK